MGTSLISLPPQVTPYGLHGPLEPPFLGLLPVAREVQGLYRAYMEETGRFLPWLGSRRRSP